MDKLVLIIDTDTLIKLLTERLLCSFTLCKKVPADLTEFSYKQSTEFRMSEQNLLNDLGIIRTTAWYKFSQLIDDNNKITFQMQQLEPYSLRRHLLPLVSSFCSRLRPTYKMSPFRWSKGPLPFSIKISRLSFDNKNGLTGTPCIRASIPMFAASVQLYQFA